jgi:hypothetical protein
LTVCRVMKNTGCVMPAIVAASACRVDDPWRQRALPAR